MQSPQIIAGVHAFFSGCLYADEVKISIRKRYFSFFLSIGKDSARFAEAYIREWIEDALLFQKAEGNIPDNAAINERVAAYRRALIMHTYEEELVRQVKQAEADETSSKHRAVEMTVIAQAELEA